jgi:hypothetical protein
VVERAHVHQSHDQNKSTCSPLQTQHRTDLCLTKVSRRILERHRNTLAITAPVQDNQQARGDDDGEMLALGSTCCSCFWMMVSSSNNSFALFATSGSSTTNRGRSRKCFLHCIRIDRCSHLSKTNLWVGVSDYFNLRTDRNDDTSRLFLFKLSSI